MLCKKYPNVEWSGLCLHEKIGDVFNEQIIVHGVYLMDIGTATATDFKGSADIAVLTEEYPEIAEMIFAKGYRILQCKVHSHNNMSSFFSQGSGVSDQQDLEDNSKTQDLYVSIVVNNKMEFFAKACRWVKTENSERTVQVLHDNKYRPFTYKVNAGIEKIVQECTVNVDMQHPEWFNKRLTEVKPAPVVKPSYNYNYNIPASVGGWKTNYWEEPVVTEVDTQDYTFEDEMSFVFGLPKNVNPKEFLKTNKIDQNVMLENFSTYNRKEESEFFEQLAEWVMDNELQESPFFNQITKFLTNA